MIQRSRREGGRMKEDEIGDVWVVGGRRSEKGLLLPQSSNVVATAATLSKHEIVVSVRRVAPAEMS